MIRPVNAKTPSALAIKMASAPIAAFANPRVFQKDLISVLEVNGKYLDSAISESLFSWQKASSKSYSDLKPGFEDNPHYFTIGIFIQKNGLVSFNHHGFQNNAG